MRVRIPVEDGQKSGGSGIPHIARRMNGARCSAFSAVPRGQNRAKYRLQIRMRIPAGDLGRQQVHPISRVPLRTWAKLQLWVRHRAGASHGRRRRASVEGDVPKEGAVMQNAPPVRGKPPHDAGAAGLNRGRA